MNSPNQRFLSQPCDKCHRGKYRNTDCHNEWWVRCPECNNYLFCYVPMPHQLRFHRDAHKYVLYGGGYGSAKTSTGGAEFLNLAFNTPNGVGLVGAATYPQLERTSKKQIMDMLPESFILKQDKKENVITLTNGYEIIFRSYDDEQKLKSLNLCHAWIEEANGVQYSIFTQLQTRLRHHATNKHKIILTTNPDMNWIRTEILLKSDKIYGTKERYPQNYSEINRNIATHIAKTEMNTHLPEGYIESVKVGKPDFWIRRYLEGSFNFAEGKMSALYKHDKIGETLTA